MPKDENIKTIRFSVKTDEKLQTIANKCGLTKLNLFVHMVDYFFKTKKDPRDLNDEMLKSSINRKTDNIVAFIRTQEQDLLIPIKKDAEHLADEQHKIYLSLQQQSDHQAKQHQAIVSQSTNILRVMDFLKKLDTAQYDKSMLKKRVVEILNFYIKNREQMTMLTKQQEKDELIRIVTAQIQGL